MTRTELDKAYAYFYVDSHPAIFGMRNDPGSLAFYEMTCKIPETVEPYEEYTLDGALIKRYKYHDSIQFGDIAAYFYWKSIEKDGSITYERDLA